MNDKIYENYRACTTIYSKPLYNGGRNFLKYNSITKKYVYGNTASTAVSDHSSGILINGVNSRELKDVIRSLENLGYKKHEIKWNTGKDTYETIRKAGL
jgi:hypothetical protein